MGKRGGLYLNMENQQYNRKTRLTPFTYKSALELAYKVVKEHVDMLDKEDIHQQGLSTDYKLTLLALEDIWLHGTKQ